MPEGTAIDLRASGVGQGEYFYKQGINDNDQGILIMFAPSGRIERVTYVQGTQTPNTMTPFDQPVVDNIYLLVGRRDRTPPPVANDLTLQTAAINGAVTDEQKAKLREPLNWLNGSSKWIVINAQAGRVGTVENGAVALDPTWIQSEASRDKQILAAREFTRDGQRLGGR